MSPSLMPRVSASCGWISSTSADAHVTLLVRRVCAPTLYCVRMRPVVSSSGYLRVARSLVGTNSVTKNLPLPRTNCPTCIVGVPSGAASVHGHWMLPSAIELLVGERAEGRRQPRDLVHDLGRVPVVHRVAQRVRQEDGDFPVLEPGARLHHLADARDPALGVGERAVLLEERRSGQEHVRVLRRLVQEQILHDDALHRLEGGGDVMRVGIRLRRILALDVHALEAAVERRLEHVRDAQARLGRAAARPSPSRTSRASRRPTRDGSR